jgi:hypothetical protein
VNYVKSVVNGKGRIETPKMPDLFHVRDGSMRPAAHGATIARGTDPAVSVFIRRFPLPTL